MARTPKPWYWRERGGWYATIDGRRRLLASDAEHGGKAKSRRAAEDAFHALMAARAAGQLGDSPPLGVVYARFLDELRARRDRGDLAARVVGDYDRRAGGFALEHAATPADRIGPADLDDYLARQNWSANTRVDFVRVLGTVYRWAKSRGLIACDPPRPSRMPARKLKRDKIPTRAEMDAIEAAARSPRFRDLIRFVGLTGCRPSEAAAIEARHVADGVATLEEHKTRRKTGDVRAIILNGPARAIVERLAAEHPAGPIFRGDEGNPWTPSAWKQAFRRARDRAGADRRITLYSFRHGRATELLIDGVDLVTTAAILGNDPAVTGRTYSGVVARKEHLRKAVERGLGAADAERPES